MTREEAIESLERVRELNGVKRCRESLAIDMVIKALKQTADKDCSRCIMRNSCLVKHEFKYMDYCQDWSEADD